MSRAYCLKSKTVEHETPQWFFDQLNAEFGFTLDPCATKENAKCAKYYTLKEDGLKQDWSGEVVFMNPPYGRAIMQWVEKAVWESGNGSTVVGLLPARTDTKWFHRYVYHKAEVRFLKGRLKFSGLKNSAPFPSMVVVWK